MEDQSIISALVLGLIELRVRYVGIAQLRGGVHGAGDPGESADHQQRAGQRQGIAAPRKRRSSSPSCAPCFCVFFQFFAPTVHTRRPRHF